jgi:hypothetical protein
VGGSSSGEFAGGQVGTRVCGGSVGVGAEEQFMPPFLSPRLCFMRSEIFLLRSREHLVAGVEGLMWGSMVFEGSTCKYQGARRGWSRGLVYVAVSSCHRL